MKIGAVTIVHVLLDHEARLRKIEKHLGLKIGNDRRRLLKMAREHRQEYIDWSKPLRRAP